ncbi:MAG TPA: hypothetical protein PK683_18485, partial [Leptospiraceae bacterium]|nr:hypothetical protein [Leptospiraceae bacterium]
GTIKWEGGALAANGKIYGIPFQSANVLVIDPSSDTASVFDSLGGTNNWVGGVYASNGIIYGIPYNSTTVLAVDPKAIGVWTADMYLSPYFNKF